METNKQYRTHLLEMMQSCKEIAESAETIANKNDTLVEAVVPIIKDQKELINRYQALLRKERIDALSNSKN